MMVKKTRPGQKEVSLFLGRIFYAFKTVRTQVACKKSLSAELLKSDSVKSYFTKTKQNKKGRYFIMERSDLCYLYDSVYSGRTRTVSSDIGRAALSNKDIGFLCRYACEYYLHWTPEQAVKNLTKPILRAMKLENLVEEMSLPDEISAAERQVYLFTLMYPELLGEYRKEIFVTAFYRAVLAGDRAEFPRSFFSGCFGAEQNARICLMYALRTYAGCRTAADCVKFMASPLAVPFLKEAKLYYVMKRKYDTPLAYVHDSLALAGLCQPDWVYRDRGAAKRRQAQAQMQVPIFQLKAPEIVYKF